MQLSNAIRHIDSERKLFRTLLGRGKENMVRMVTETNKRASRRGQIGGVKQRQAVSMEYEHSSEIDKVMHDGKGTNSQKITDERTVRR